MPDDVFGARREFLRDVFRRALAEETVVRAMQRCVTPEPGGLRIENQLVPLTAQDKLKIVAIGKAAGPMSEALAAYLPIPWKGVVASPVAAAAKLKGFDYFQGGHPLPNQDSLDAGEAILDLLANSDDKTQVIFLLSGGGSACAEKALDPRMMLDDIVAVNRALVHCGAPISEINTIRKHLSAIKGGRLSCAAGKAKQLSLLVSDVPDNAPDALASGPTMPDSTTVNDCYDIVKRYQLLFQFPRVVREMFENGRLTETPKITDSAFMRSRWVTMLSNASLVSAAQEEMTRQGMTLTTDHGCDDWDYRKAADYLLQKLRELRRKDRPVCLISGGEVTVSVKDGGVGGRNQQFATYCAVKIAGENVAVLSAGSDGVDGNSTAAGAVVDGTTLERAQVRGFDLRSSLASFDTFPLLQALGDAIITGPTGNNLRDLRILVAW